MIKLLSACCCALVLTCLAGSAALPDAQLDEFLKDARTDRDWIIRCRRHLHQWPELLFDVHNTSSYIKQQLDQLGITYTAPAARSGVVASIGSGRPVVVLRADIDALPIQEEADVPFKSKVPGKMHACGHDGHTAMLLGAGKLLKQREAELKGTVRMMFQPAEEGGAGGHLLVQEGHLKGASAVFGFHLWPGLPTGTLHTNRATIMASAVQFEITVTGKGGHAAMPHQNKDPVVAGAAIVTALQALVSRETSPLSSAVVSITRLRAGEAYNVIPDTASLGGTLRTLKHEDSMNLRKRIEEVTQQTAAAGRCTAEVDWMLEAHPYYPNTYNDPSLTAFAEDVGARLLKRPVEQAEPSMAGEDFSFYTHAGNVPSTFIWLGIQNAKTGAGTHALHTPKYMMDEDMLPVGAALHTALAMEFLERGGATAAHDRQEL